MEILTPNVDVAYEVLQSFWLGGKISSRAENEISKCANRQETLLRAIELCGDESTPEALYVISNCFVLLGAKYRKDAIVWLEKFIEAGAFCSDRLSTQVQQKIKRI